VDLVDGENGPCRTNAELRRVAHAGVSTRSWRLLIIVQPLALSTGGVLTWTGGQDGQEGQDGETAAESLTLLPIPPVLPILPSV
jgi:hypothetical protein